MEKFSAFRDKGSGIAPFLPVSVEASGVALPFHIFLCFIRVPLLVAVSLAYFLVVCWLPIGSLGRKAALWCILGIPGVWWVDLQVDGVKRGSLGSNGSKLPHPGSVIASTFTSPLDALYLATIFDPIFTRSFPNLRQVQQISLWRAIVDALSDTPADPSVDAKLVDVATLINDNPDRCVAVFPECTTSNGRAVLPFSPSLLTVPEKIKIFPVSLRYSPQDVITAVPGTWVGFLWALCSRPTHCIRVRIAAATYNTSISFDKLASGLRRRRTSYDTNLLDDLHQLTSDDSETGDDLSRPQRDVLDRIGEALARLGRVRRVGVGVKEKEDFVRAWTKRK